MIDITKAVDQFNPDKITIANIFNTNIGTIFSIENRIILSKNQSSYIIHN